MLNGFTDNISKFMFRPTEQENNFRRANVDIKQDLGVTLDIVQRVQRRSRDGD